MIREKMQNIQMKRVVILSIPYLIIFYLADKCFWLYRHCMGNSMIEKIGVMLMNFPLAFTNWFPSFYLQDLLGGVIVALIFRIVLYYKAKNAKKFRHGEEYGSARWGNRKDIEPFEDPVFENNIILTETERLTMNSRPKAPKYARNKNVIVIGRQYGCGGHDIGKKLAEKFGYEFYDQEIIQMIAGTTGMTSEFIRQKEESMTNSLLYDFVNQMYLYGKEEEEAPKDKIFEAESKVIRELAAKGKCVIIGRCSDYVLCENEKTLKLFFAAPLEVRAKRIMERLNISKKEAEQVIRKEDRRRADNYRYYTGRVWGSAANVDLTFNTAMDERYIEECISKAMELEI